MTARPRKAVKRSLTWEEPPPTKVSYDWDFIADELREHPMEWAKVFEQDRTSVVNALRQGNIQPLHPDLGFEFRTAHNVREPIRMCDLYARFNPDRVNSLRATVRSARKAKA